MAHQSLRDEAKSIVKLKFAEGFEDPDTILQNTVEMLLDENDEAVVRPLVTDIVRQAHAAHAQAQRLWPAVTDCDRLDAAFEELNAAGIMARHHWTCCGNCGRAEMPGEFDRLDGQWEGKPIIGYTFYHQQGTEAAAEGSGLGLSYGSTEPADSEREYEAQAVRIGETIRRVLTKHGITVTWDGKYATIIWLTIQWQRRSRPLRFCGDDNGTGGAGEHS